MHDPCSGLPAAGGLPLRAFAGLALLLGSGCAAVSSPSTTSKPHIVVILADDMGYGDPRCNNPDSRIATPHIDRLAAEGMRFTDAHAPAAWCTPTRFGLLTGSFPCRQVGGWRRRCIAAGRPTLATMLAQAGYATAMVGKWHLGFDGDRRRRDWLQPLVGGPLDCGFASYFGIPASLDIPPYYYIRDRHAVAPPTGRAPASASPGWTKIQGAFWRAGGLAPGFTHAEVLPRSTAAAVTCIEQHSGDQPLFLYLALPAPHTPWLPSPQYRGKSGASMYGDFVMQVDATVGAVLAALERRGIAEQTMVLFTSDNGPVWYPSDVERLGHAAVGPLRGMKSDAWEGGHRMPFVVRWPARVPAGTVSKRLLCFTDLMATLATVAQTSVPNQAGQDSVDFSPTLFGATQTPRGPLILKANGSVLRDGRFKLITHLGSGGFSTPRKRKPVEGGPEGQLYDLEADLGETHNLWSERPELVARMRATLQRLRKAR